MGCGGSDERTEFRHLQRQRAHTGFDEIVERQWKPDTTVATHTHSFAVKALVVQGEMWLSVGDHTQHLLPGDTFELGRDVPHAERYGKDGATYWAARRNRSEP